MTDKKLRSLTEKEWKLVELWREMKYGIIEEIHIEGGQPVRIKAALKNIKL